MQLSEYLNQKNLSHADFAQLVGVDPVTVHRWVNGRRFPLYHLEQIRRATNGKVTADDFALPKRARA